jgi:hypothetical protein
MEGTRGAVSALQIISAFHDSLTKNVGKPQKDAYFDIRDIYSTKAEEFDKKDIKSVSRAFVSNQLLHCSIRHQAFKGQLNQNNFSILL